ncbi:aldolase/citrate lyase family protein [Candidatus Bathyarchaeota archaeon]|nr:aldolase/citrate lyase family protein [Candidatus Bathyarchaeota archaeon]
MKEYMLKKSIREGRVLCGMSISTPAPSLLEIVGYSGFDFTYVDLEHSVIDLEFLTNMVVASELSGMGTLVRVSDNQGTPIRKALEIGADGVIVPHVNTREDAENAVQAARFPPRGKRGFGAMVRASHFNLPAKGMEEYAWHSNEGVIVVAQIEEREAVENIDEITDTEGIDALLLGPSDLSLSLGIPGQFQKPEMVASINRVMETAQRKRIPVMCTVSYLVRPVTVESIRAWIDKGLRLLLFGSVEGLVRQACLNTIENYVNKIR